MDNNAFLAGLAVGRRLKGWASGGDLSVGISGSGGTTDKYLTIASFTPIEASLKPLLAAGFLPVKTSISTAPVEASLRPLITDYTED